MSRRYPKKYQAQALCGLIGLIIIFCPFFLKLPSRFQSFNAANDLETEAEIEKARVSTSEDVERSRISQRKETADELKRAGVMPSTKKLKIINYYDSAKKDPKPETTGFLASDQVRVYDSAGRCIGMIKNRKWHWKHNFPQFCQGSG